MKEGSDLEKYGLNSYKYIKYKTIVQKKQDCYPQQSTKQKTIRTARSSFRHSSDEMPSKKPYCYWKNIERDIVNIKKNCKQCCKKQSNTYLVYFYIQDKLKKRGMNSY